MLSLSIVLPAYNEEANVAGAVEQVSTVACQLGMDYEIILVNDGSADRTGEVGRELAQRIPKFQVDRALSQPGLWGRVESRFCGSH